KQVVDRAAALLVAAGRDAVLGLVQEQVAVRAVRQRRAVDGDGVLRRIDPAARRAHEDAVHRDAAGRHEGRGPGARADAAARQQPVQRAAFGAPRAGRRRQGVVTMIALLSETPFTAAGSTIRSWNTNGKPDGTSWGQMKGSVSVPSCSVLSV